MTFNYKKKSHHIVQKIFFYEAKDDDEEKIHLIFNYEVVNNITIKNKLIRNLVDYIGKKHYYLLTWIQCIYYYVGLSVNIMLTFTLFEYKGKLNYIKVVVEGNNMFLLSVTAVYKSYKSDNNAI